MLVKLIQNVYVIAWKLIIFQLSIEYENVCIWCGQSAGQMVYLCQINFIVLSCLLHFSHKNLIKIRRKKLFRVSNMLNRRQHDE